jgi:hypothetical protein
MKKQLKHRWIIVGIIAAVFLASCTGFFDLGEKEIIRFEGETFIYFNNEGSSYAVDVFSSNTRGVKIASVSANEITGKYSWIPTPENEGYEFFLTYKLPLLPGVEIPFIPRKYGVDYITVGIPKDKETEVRVQLSPIPSDEALFSNEVWVAIKNNYNSAIQFMSGSGALQPVQGSSLISSDYTSLYKLTPATNITSYTILVQNNRKPLPSDLTEFKDSWFYAIDLNYDSTVTLKDSKLLTLENL